MAAIAADSSLVETDSSTEASLSSSTATDSSAAATDPTGAAIKPLALNTLMFKGASNKEIHVLRGLRLRDNKERGFILYSAMNAITGEQLVIVKWSLPYSKNLSKKESRNKIERHLFDIRNRMEKLMKLKHGNLVRYLGMTLKKKEKWVSVYILQEYVQGISLYSLCKVSWLTTEQVRFLAKEILLALKFLHEHSVFHKSLRASSIFINQNGCVQLSDYSIGRRLHKLSIISSTETEHPSAREYDIYCLGKLLRECLGYQGNTDLTIPHPSNSFLGEFLDRCLKRDTTNIPSVTDLLTHKFLTTSSSVSTLESESDESLKSGNEKEQTSQPMINSEICQTAENFVILEALGKGAFGKVFTVRHALDNMIYAMKCIPLKLLNEEANTEIKKEVEILCRLNHENVVRYYSSSTGIVPGVEIDGDYYLEDLGYYQSESDIQEYEPSADGSNDEDKIADCSSENCLDIKKRTSNGSLSIVFVDEVSNNSSEKECPTRKRDISTRPQCLCIRMEFCGKTTLRNSINNNLYEHEPSLVTMYYKILDGLHYIHEQGIIHRDLKPENIFINSNGVPKIGDFGLAITVSSSHLSSNDKRPECSLDCDSKETNNMSNSSVEDAYHTANVGTFLYRAPELTSDSSTTRNNRYTKKVDLYSLGIILFEMSRKPFDTAAQRIENIQIVRAIEIEHESILVHLVGKAWVRTVLCGLLQHDPSRRKVIAQNLADTSVFSKVRPWLRFGLDHFDNIFRS